MKKLNINVFQNVHGLQMIRPCLKSYNEREYSYLGSCKVIDVPKNH